MLNIIEKLPYFTLDQLNTFVKNKNTARVYVSRWMKSGKIISIKRWYYISSKKNQEINIRGDYNNYIEFLATNIIYTPSYISLEYILFKNNIITENIYNITLVTTKKTKKVSNSFLNLNYKSIKKDLFWWYKLIKRGELFFYEAEIEKALLDYFWFKKDIVWDNNYFEELRLNLDTIDFEKLYEYWNKFNSKKINRILIFITNLKW